MIRLVLLILLLALPAQAATITGGKVYGGSVGAAGGAPPSGDWAATFGPCTAGTDCFCDQLLGDGLGPATGTNYGAGTIAYCEDYDHDAYYATTPTDVDDAFTNENWISTAGAVFGSGDRGGGSRFVKKFGLATWDGLTWQDGEPTTTCGGVITSVGGSGIGSGIMEWDADDRWCANAYNPRIDIIHLTTDFSAENGSAVPTIPGSGGASIFGDNLLALRNVRFTQQGKASKEFDLGSSNIISGTVALGYESNVSASGILAGPWKHDEYGGVSGTNDDGLWMFRQSNSSINTFPYQGFMFASGLGVPCSTIVAGTTGIGTVFCTVDGHLVFHAADGLGTNQYRWPNDFDLTELHCASMEWDFTTIDSVRVRMWHDGELIMDLDGIDLTGSYYDGGGGTNGLDYFVYNNYANLATGGGIADETRRYMDNYVYRRGSPVLCSDIGFPSSYNQAGL
jgi:hypothetical protein